MRVQKIFLFFILLTAVGQLSLQGSDHLRDVDLRLREKAAYLACLKAKMGHFKRARRLNGSESRHRFVATEIARLEKNLLKLGITASSLDDYLSRQEGKNKADEEFYADYLDHLLYLVAVFHEKSNEVKALDCSEILGDQSPENMILLTFDDGPDPEGTKAVLDVLKAMDVPATFFVLGKSIERYGEEAQSLLRRMTAEGHAIGLHGWEHGVMDRGDPDPGLVEKLQLSIELIQKNCGGKPAFFRAPYGRRNLALVKELGSLGLRHVLWNIDSLDWNRKLDDGQVRERVVRLARLHDGGIVLFHDPVLRTAGILGDLLRQLQAEGFQFRSLKECKVLGDKNDSGKKKHDRADKK